MKIGFIGLGAMGAPMAANLVRAGHEVSVYDVDGGKTEAFAKEYAAKAMPSPTTRWDVEILITMLPTGAIVRSVLLDNGGIGLPPGSLVIDMSSSEPSGTRELGAELARRQIALIDAPVSGGVPRARDGGLTIMVGSDDPALIERARPVLSVLGNRIFETGRLGTGHAVKALNNYVTAASYIATSEALLIGRRFGLEPATLIEILNASTGRTFHSDITMKHHVLTEKYATGFALALATKDVRIAKGLAEAVGFDAPMVRLTHERLATAYATLGEGTDISAAIKAWDA